MGIKKIKCNPDDYTEEIITELDSFNVYYLINNIQDFFDCWKNKILEGQTEEEKEKSLKTIETYLRFLRIYIETFFNTYENGYTELVNRQTEENNRKKLKLTLKTKVL